MLTTSERRIRTVLVVDDDERLRRASIRALIREGRRPLAATCHWEALDVIRRERVDLAVLDLVLRGESGLELHYSLKAAQPDLVIVLMSGMFCVSSIQRAYRAGAFDCVEKPLEWPALLHAVEHGRKLESQRRDDIPSFDEWKREYYLRLVELTGGNITKAAALAGIRRTSLQRILRH